MPVDYSRYPKDWRAISASIRERAGDRCECEGECGLHPDKRCDEVNGADAQYARGRVMLTVAHLDHTPEHCDPSNLKAMCQRCHLRYDTKLHMAHARQTRHARRAVGPLPGLDTAD